MYEYRAKLARVIDGDTVVLDIDLGLDVTHRIVVRVLGINCPERFTEEGKQATAFTKLFLENRDLTITTVKDSREKYGRYLARIYVDNLDLTSLLLSKGLGQIA